MKRGLTKFLLAVDYYSDGIRIRILIAAAALQVFFAPLWDQYLRGGNPDHKASTHEPITFIATLIFLSLGSTLLAGRLLALSMDEDESDARTERPSLLRMFSVGIDQLRRYWRLMWLESPAPFFAKLGAALCVILMAFRGASGLLRWLGWKSMKFFDPNVTPDSIFSGPRQVLEKLYSAEIKLQHAVDLIAFPVALLAAWAFLRKPRRSDSPAALREPRALAGVNPLVARRDPSSRQRIGGAFQGDLVHRLLHDLSEWEPGRKVKTEHQCRDDIAFFLRKRRTYRIDTERWIGSGGKRRRVDLMIDDCIPIELKYGLHEKQIGEHDRAHKQVQTYAEIWGTAGPVLLFLAATSREGVTPFQAPTERWNAALDGKKAPILVLTDP